MKNKIYVSTFDESSGFIVEKWNHSTQQYERFWPKEGVLSELVAKEIAKCCNYLKEE
jgi:hypothetical protein